MPKMYHIIWPDDRQVTGEELIAWAKDDVANGNTSCIDPPKTVKEAIEILEDTGSVTFHRDNFED
ncbi:MAG: hypothetical protein ACRD4G_13640 [Bryobacteraceae bacterium]